MPSNNEITRRICSCSI